MSYPGGYFAELREKYSDSEIINQISVSANTVWILNGPCGTAQYRTYPTCLIQRNIKNMYHSERGKVAEIVFDMGSPFSITGFAMKGLSACAYLKSYSFKGSDNKINWNLIKYNSNDDLHHNNNWHYYPVKKFRYRYYGIFQDPNASVSAFGSDYYFPLQSVDFTGSYKTVIGRNTCVQRISSSKSSIIIGLLLMN